MSLGFYKIISHHCSAKEVSSCTGEHFNSKTVTNKQCIKFITFIWGSESWELGKIII